MGNRSLRPHRVTGRHIIDEDCICIEEKAGGSIDRTPHPNQRLWSKRSTLLVRLVFLQTPKLADTIPKLYVYPLVCDASCPPQHPSPGRMPTVLPPYAPSVCLPLLCSCRQVKRAESGEMILPWWW